VKPVLVIAGLIFMLFPNMLTAKSASGAYHMTVNTEDVKSLQRGARIFVNYCMGCHSASYMRYNRLAADLDIREEILKSNFMFGTDKTGNTMEIAMKGSDALRFFGVVPPDLSVIARSRGADWLYQYFLTFYRDSSRPTGVNNLAFKDVAMPHVLWDLQGYQKPVYRKIVHADGSTSEIIEKLEQDTAGRMQPEEYRKAVQDLVNFLVYLSEPVKLQRQKIGLWVIIYLLAFAVVAYLLKKEYWKDVH
jgi:ubiquinol-cytochrome c reductase cytochrome c1 subunit